MITRLQTKTFNKHVFASSFDNAKIVRFCGDLGGFDTQYNNDILDLFNTEYPNTKFLTEYQLPNEVKQKYNNLTLDYDYSLWRENLQIRQFEMFKQHPDVNIKNLVCSFNAKDNCGSRMLFSYLCNNDMYNSEFVSKHFTINLDQLYRDIEQNTDNNNLDQIVFGKNNKLVNEYGNDVQRFGTDVDSQSNNLNALSSKIAQSFAYVVSENVSTSSVPYISEKFLFGIVNRSLFLAWAPPGWHRLMSQSFGFKLYENIFDYSFDSETNPLKRLRMLMANIAVYKSFNADEWQELRNCEIDTIQYNYEHFFSKKYADRLEQAQYINLN